MNLFVLIVLFLCLSLFGGVSLSRAQELLSTDWLTADELSVSGDGHNWQSIDNARECDNQMARVGKSLHNSFYCLLAIEIVELEFKN